MLEYLAYWLLYLELVSLAALPLAYRTFSYLPDRGYALSKPLGVLGVAFVAWWIAFSQVVPNSRWSVAAALALVVAASVLAIRGRTWEFVAHLRQNARTIAAIEVLFLGLFVLFGLFRATNPDILHTEQPMDFMFLNAVVTSPSFPPADPWLAGQAVSYYYFGYWTIGALTLLSGLGTEFTYNLGLATIAALGGIGAFGVAYNLVRMAGGTARGAGLAGLASVFLLLFAGNIASGLEMWRAAGGGDAEFWSGVGVAGLAPLEQPSSTWRPEGFWWWWGASRVIPGTINEFPNFSFVLGDLHPHVMSLAFVPLVAGLSIQLYAMPSVLRLVDARHVWALAFAAATLVAAIGLLLAVFAGDVPDQPFVFGAVLVAAGLALTLLSGVVVAVLVVTGMRNDWAFWLVLVLGLGALATVNLWDLPLGVALVGGALLLNAARYGNGLNRRLGRAILLAASVTFWALVAYLPFYTTFEATGDGISPLRGEVTRPLHMVLVWGLFAPLVVGFLAAMARPVLGVGGNWPLRMGAVLYIVFAPFALWMSSRPALLIPVVLFMLATVIVFALRRVGFRPLQADEINIIGSGSGMTFMLGSVLLAFVLLVGGLRYGEGSAYGEFSALQRFILVAPMGLIAFATMYGAWSLAHRDSVSWYPRFMGRVEALGLMAIATMLVMGAELYRVIDIFGNRMNTVFKLHYEAWILLAIAGGVAAWYVTSRFDRRVLQGRVGVAAWCALLLAMFGISAYYPMAAMASRAADGEGLGLDGQAHVQRTAPAEHEAIAWVRANLPRDAVVVEAAEVPCNDASGGCSDWTDAGRIASSTGRPTILGWEQHESQWRANDSAIVGRRADVRTIYETQDIAEASALLSKYGADYVVVGARERSAYGTGGIDKFAQMGSLDYTASSPGDLRIYRLSAGTQ